MANNQLELVLNACHEARSLISQLRAAGVDVPDEEARQPVQIMVALYDKLIDTGEALATMNMVLKRLKAVADQEGVANG
jgi:hypothetical protein